MKTTQGPSDHGQNLNLEARYPCRYSTNRGVGTTTGNVNVNKTIYSGMYRYIRARGSSLSAVSMEWQMQSGCSCRCSLNGEERRGEERRGEEGI